jgi:hypothetical protein
MIQRDIGCDRILLRTGAVAAVAGVVTALVQTAVDPSMPDDPVQAIRKASESNLLPLSRLLDMAAFLLLLVAVAVITRALIAGPGAAWARIGLAFFTVSAGARRDRHDDRRLAGGRRRRLGHGASGTTGGLRRRL